jgi:hypothetical protein
MHKRKQSTFDKEDFRRSRSEDREDEFERILSVDLKNATYNMSHDIMNENFKLFDLAMYKFGVWKCFHKLYKINSREVDVSVLQQHGYFEEYLNPKVITYTGCFMGDSLSFIHLTVMLLSIVEQATSASKGFVSETNVYKQVYQVRPIGQSVGDDVIVFDVPLFFCLEFERIAAGMGLIISKIQSKSNDSGTFCEQYLYRLTREEVKKEEGNFSPTTLFGDLLFLDVFKGSIFSGKSKVKQDGNVSLLGHGKLLQKQMSWMPPSLTGKMHRAKTLLWSRHYREVVGLSRALPSLPSFLGGLDIPVGRHLTLSDPSLERSYLPYYYGILATPDQAEYLINVELLLSIWRTSGKGFTPDLTDETLAKVMSEIKVIPATYAYEMLPAYAAMWTWPAKRELLDRMFNLIPLASLGNEMVRRDAFLKWWQGKRPPKKEAMLLDPKRFRERHLEVWDRIRKNVKPAARPFDVNSLSELNNKIAVRAHNLFFDRNDPVILEAYMNMPSLHLNLH